MNELKKNNKTEEKKMVGKKRVNQLNGQLHYFFRKKNPP